MLHKLHRLHKLHKLHKHSHLFINTNYLNNRQRLKVETVKRKEFELVGYSKKVRLPTGQPNLSAIFTRSWHKFFHPWFGKAKPRGDYVATVWSFYFLLILVNIKLL